MDDMRTRRNDFRRASSGEQRQPPIAEVIHNFDLPSLNVLSVYNLGYKLRPVSQSKLLFSALAMPPPMPNPAKRFTANPARPVGRYRPGKAVQEEESDEEGFETEEEEAPVKPQPRQPQRTITKQKTKQATEVDEDEEGFVTEEDEEEEDKPSAIPTKVQGVTDPLAGETANTAHSDITSEEESEEESSEEDESSESEPEPVRKFQRPTFIKKSERNHDVTNSATPAPADSTPDPAEESRRKAMAELMIKDELEKVAAARLAGKKYWDDDEDLAPEDMVDDTDGLDPVLERKEWEIRELKRLKRDRERIEAREKEIEEIERRRNLSKEEREREDAEYIAQQKEAKDGKGETGFMKKYYHKGAFFMDDETTRRLAERDIMGKSFQDDVDKSTLPEYMRIRDLNKLGKTGGTKYRDLRSEDTGRFGDEVQRWRPGDKARERDETIGGVDERFMSDRDRERLGPTSSGANATAVGTRRPRRSASRSRSPPRRKRSSSPYQERDDKRRRTEVDAR
jgi:microfibrillar-associated protein 1